MNNKQLYEIRLEDYSFPRYMPVVKSYYGTRDNIIDLISHLCADSSTNTRYRETIEAAESFDGTSMPVHTVAAHIVPVLTPVQEVGRFETQLTNHCWSYQAYGGEIYPCQADSVEVCQNLIRTETEYVRCLRAQVFGLRICRQGMGWVSPGNVIKGFPGIVTWNGIQHTLNLFVAQQHYDLDELAQAMSDMVDINRIDLSVISADILAEG